MKVAAIQMVSSMNVEENLNNMKKMVTKAANENCKLVLLPEFFAFLSDNNQDIIDLAENPQQFAEGVSNFNIYSPIQNSLSKTAKQNNLWLIAGSIPIRTKNPKKISNSMLVFDDKGLLVGRYDKMHLFKFKNEDSDFDESKFIKPGDNRLFLQTPAGNTLFSICYDIRFPEFFRHTNEKSALVDLIVVSAAFTHATGKSHWETLLKARAIENQCYVLASAQGGKHECGRETWGHSMVINPWGDIIDQCKFDSDIVFGIVEKDFIQKVRKKLPAIFHKRYDI